MKLKKLRGAVGLLLAGALLFTSVPASSLPNLAMAAEKWEEVDNPTLRDYATPSVSYIGYGMGGDNFADESEDSFWNAHGDPNLQTKDQWMMYDFGTRKAAISGMKINFLNDGGGVVEPTAITAEYKDASGNWVKITEKGTWKPAANTSTEFAFDAVTTSAIRVTMSHAKDSSGKKIPVAVKDWLLLGDIPADFPKPVYVTPEAPSPDLNLQDVAVYATPNAHYTSAWENLNGINDSSFNPSSSSMGQTGLGWGNWGYPGAKKGDECWVEYNWDAEITAKTFQVYWYADSGDMKMPSNVRFEYKDKNGEFQKATLKSIPKNFLKFNKYNQITIEPVTTKTIRMYMTVSGTALGVYRWKVHSEVDDNFVVSAAAGSLVIPEVREGRVSSRTNEQLTLPSKAMNNLVDVSWKSKTPTVVSDDGKITAPDENTKVTLTATCSLSAKPEIKTEKDVEFLVLSKDTTEYAMTIDRKNKGVDISQELFGVFYEDINSSADGGLSTELVKNNSFQNYQALDSATAPEVKGDQNSWKLHWKSSSDSNFTVENTDGLNDKNKNYAKITGSQVLSNHGFVEKASLDKSAMPIRDGLKYDFSMYMKADKAYAGNVKVKVVDDAGTAITNEVTLNLKKDGKWNKITASLTGNATKLGTINLTFDGAGASDVMYIDMVSLIPTDGYGYGNKNYSYGAGLRKDLVEKLQQLNPSFIRFPGGCVIEGSYGTDGYYNWEDSVGPLEERRAIGSYWGTPGHPETGNTANYGYMMSYQFGYHEILTLCEDLGAQAFPILSAGIYCQFRETADAVTGDALEPFAKHATNLIDYCWGDPNSKDETQAYWAKKRVENGHADQFDLNYLGIGNENWGQIYYDNYRWIKKYVEDYVKEHYPDRKITLISSTGPYYQGGQNTEAWNWINSTMPGETLVDEHYYISYAGDGNNTLLNDDYAYDGYKRLNEGGSNVFIGEYAGHYNAVTQENVLDAAISEAAYMTGIERNADIVRHASYAPLFEKEGCRDWNYNLIKFDAYNSYGTPSYYVQTMYSNNYGKHIIDTTLEKYDSRNGVATAYDKKPGHQTDLYYVTSEDDNYLYTKLVNHADYEKDITLNYPGIENGAKVELICLSGESMDMNTITEPEKIVPVTTNTTLSGESMTYKVPAMSLTVVKVEHTKLSKTALNNSIKTAKAKKQMDYNASSWRKLKSQLAKAESVAKKSEAKQDEIDKAQSDLDNAVKGLVKLKTTVTKKATLGVNETLSVKAKGYTYLSSNTKAAVVNSKGLITAKKTGSAQIKAIPENGNKATVYKITVKKAPSKISKVTMKLKGKKKASTIRLKKNKGNISLKKNQTATLTASIPSGTAGKITYTSSNKKIATVDAKGVVKVKKKKGTTKITIKTYNKKSVEITIKVK